MKPFRKFVRDIVHGAGSRRSRRFEPLTLFFLVFTSIVAFCAGPPLQFAKMIGTQYGHAVASDSQGNIYVGTGPYDVALVKYDPNGNVLWSFGKAQGNAGLLEIRGIFVDGADDIYVCGTVWGTVKAGGINYTQTSSSTFFGKFTSTGSNTFAKIFYNLYSNTKPFGRTSDGRFFVVGDFSNPVTYEGITVSPTANSDSLVFKINADGSPIWYRRGTGNLNDVADAVVSSSDGGVAVAGASESSSFGMAGIIISNTSSRSLYLIKMDDEGAGVWAKSAGSSMEADGPTSAITFSTNANAIIWAGDFTGSLNLSSPPISSSGGKDVFVAKVSPTGTVLWVRTLGGLQDQLANAASVDRFGNIYVAGFFSGSMKIGSFTLNSLGLRDIFVAKFRDNGTPVWAKRIGSPGNDDEVALSFTPVGDLLVTGTVRGGTSIDGTFLEGINQSDAFIAKFHSEGIPPRFTIDPQDRVISAGMTFTLTAELAINDPSVRFQWWFNGATLPGRTNQTLTITNSQFTNAGSYYLVATNDAGPVTSAPALISYTDASMLLLSVHPSLTIFGTPGKVYRIEYSTEPRAAAQWTIATNLALISSPEVWIDPTAASGEKRFYRVLLLP
jgi:hypothetical protein